MFWILLCLVIVAFYGRAWLIGRTRVVSCPLPPSALYLRRCRESARLTRARAARIAGVEIRRIRELETGAPESNRGEAWRIGHELRRWTDDQARKAVGA